MRRGWLLAPLLVSAVVGLFDADAYPGDLPLFLRASGTLLSADWASTFADDDLQVGPLLLAAVGVAAKVAALVGLQATTLLAVAIEVGVAGSVMFVAHRLLAGRTRARQAAMAAGFVAVAVGVGHHAFVSGHPAQAVIPLVWVLAGLEARRGRPLRAGVLVGLSSGLETWGVLGAPLLLLCARPRAAAAGVAALGAVAAALFLPFALAGDFRMLDYAWYVADGTLPGLMLPDGAQFPWELRLVQGGAALAAGAILALGLRSRGVSAVWLAPAAAVAVRLALDPILYSWYWQALATLAIVGAADVLTSSLVVRRGHGLVSETRTWLLHTRPRL